MNLCLTCRSETANPKFCSRRCSISFNNRLKPKRTRRRFFCDICGAEAGYRRKFCAKHILRGTITSQTTIGVIRSRSKHQVNARIRQLARQAYRRLGLPLSCQVCGYSTHVEICHKRGISEFPDNALVSEVNSLQNLVCLCPNHHWEFDHGFLSL